MSKNTQLDTHDTSILDMKECMSTRKTKLVNK